MLDIDAILITLCDILRSRALHLVKTSWNKFSTTGNIILIINKQYDIGNAQSAYGIGYNAKFENVSAFLEKHV